VESGHRPTAALRPLHPRCPDRPREDPRPGLVHLHGAAPRSGG
jgi:hypothetical protein